MIVNKPIMISARPYTVGAVPGVVETGYLQIVFANEFAIACT